MLPACPNRLVLFVRSPFLGTMDYTNPKQMFFKISLIWDHYIYKCLYIACVFPCQPGGISLTTPGSSPEWSVWTQVGPASDYGWWPAAPGTL